MTRHGVLFTHFHSHTLHCRWGDARRGVDFGMSLSLSLSTATGHSSRRTLALTHWLPRCLPRTPTVMESPTKSQRATTKATLLSTARKVRHIVYSPPFLFLSESCCSPSSPSLLVDITLDGWNELSCDPLWLRFIFSAADSVITNVIKGLLQCPAFSPPRKQFEIENVLKA